MCIGQGAHRDAFEASCCRYAPSARRPHKPAHGELLQLLCPAARQSFCQRSRQRLCLHSATRPISACITASVTLNCMLCRRPSASEPRSRSLRQLASLPAASSRRKAEPRCTGLQQGQLALTYRSSTRRWAEQSLRSRSASRGTPVLWQGHLLPGLQAAISRCVVLAKVRTCSPVRSAAL